MYLPGGGVKEGKMAEHAARREAATELGAQLRNLRLVGVYSNFREHKSDHIVVLAGQTGCEIAVSLSSTAMICVRMRLSALYAEYENTSVA